MTEYTTSSEAIREYMTSRERTAYWVQSHAPIETEFYSPSVPPSEIDGLYPSSPPSEAESSRSIPPRMRLCYGDGRPDSWIAPAPPQRSGRRPDDPSRSSRTSSNSAHRPRAGSHGSSPLATSSHSRRPEYSERPPPSPEEITVFPTHGSNGHRPSHQPRSKSLPRSADLHSQQQTSIPPVPHQGRFNQGPMHGQQVTFTQPQPPAWHHYNGRPQNSQKQPPAIVYAPSHHSRTHYSPPVIYNHPPQMGPNGMIYSHSAPTQYSRSGRQTPYPSTVIQPSRPLASVHEENRRRGAHNAHHDRARSLSTARPVSPSSSDSSLTSQGSGSTYYVLPAAGQKVHVIVPSPQPSITTATSTTARSPTSPGSSSFKKSPFFQRLFNFAGKFSSGSSAKGSTSGGGLGRRRLQRRHSTGGSGRGRSVTPVVVD